MATGMPLEERVIIALDLPDISAARRLIDALGDEARFFKIGYELAFIGGLDLAHELVTSGRKVFLDLKLHDIPNTIEKGVSQIAGLGATYLTVHAYPQTMAAAVKGAAGSRLGILGVSVLTSMDGADLEEAGYGLDVASLVARRAKQVEASGCAGLICSAADIAPLRDVVGAGFSLITPGIRPAGSAIGDQKRVMTPGAAIKAGASQLVIGRPISAASEPRAALRAILDEISTV